MVFVSFIFLFWFLPLFLPLYFAAPVRWRNVALTLGSFAFYGWWRPQYVLLMLGSVLIDYWAARRMGEPSAQLPPGRRKLWLLAFDRRQPVRHQLERRRAVDRGHRVE